MEEVAKNGLVVLLKENNIEESTALSLSSSFDEFYKQANEWKAKATEFLNNPELSDEEKVKESRTARLALVKVRTSIEKKRKELNEEDQQKIADRNSAAKVLTALVTPTETLLLEKEKEAEIADNKRKEALKEARETALKNYNVDCQFFDLANMPDEAFKILLDNSALAFRAKAEEVEREEQRKQIEEKLNQRIILIRNLGFTSENNVDFDHTNGMSWDGEEIQNVSDEKFNKIYSDVKAECERLADLKQKAKEAEENRLKAEKEELERKNLLLEQQEKERQQKHNAAVYRQQAAARMNIVLSYEAAAEMTEPGWTEWFNEKDKEYQTEQNRLFIEKKKKERDEAIAKEKQARVQKRIDQLLSMDFQFAEMRNEWFFRDPEFLVPIKWLEEYDTTQWDEIILDFISRKEEKRAAELAPDKEKIIKAIDAITFSSFDEINLTTKEGVETFNQVLEKYLGFKNWANALVDKMK
jgi:hypothetical protein